MVWSHAHGSNTGGFTPTPKASDTLLEDQPLLSEMGPLNETLCVKNRDQNPTNMRSLLIFSLLAMVSVPPSTIFLEQVHAAEMLLGMEGREGQRQLSQRSCFQLTTELGKQIQDKQFPVKFFLLLFFVLFACFRNVKLSILFLYVPNNCFQFSSVAQSDSLRPHESQHARPPCPSPTPGVHSNSHPQSQ